jgi:hypothetical protein
MASPITDLITSKVGTGASVMSGIWLATISIIILGILGAIIVFVWKQKQFRYKVHVLEELGNGGTRIYHDRGRIVERPDGTRVFQLRHFKKTTLQIPELESMMVGNKGNKEVFLKKFGINEFDFIPLGLHLKALRTDVEPFAQGRKNWISTELKRSAQRHGGFWDKYGGMITAFGTLTLGLVMIVIIFKMAQEIGLSLSDSASAVREGMTQMSAQCGALGTPAQVSNPPGF